MDDLIAQTGVNCRALACASFMENFLRQVEPVRTQGLFYSPVPGALKIPTCATRDIAAAARLLLDKSWSGVDEVPVLGPEDLSNHDMAGIISEVLGRPVRFEEMSMDALSAMLKGRGMSAGMTQAMVNMITARNEGMDNMVQRTPQTNNPTSFRQWCEEVLRPAVLN